jgi:sugar/nucleoside kinase (ribokinase family)
MITMSLTSSLNREKSRRIFRDFCAERSTAGCYMPIGRKREHTFQKYLFLRQTPPEAEVITGISDRYDAARQLSDWGAGEVMVTYNTEVIVYDGHDFYKEPLKPRNLSGRTGRGDTCFGSYIAKRLTATPEESLLYAAAAVSLKMETPGPFKGTAEDVKQYIDAFYR